MKEPDGDAVGDDAPELPVGPHANHVTPRGLQLLQSELKDLDVQRQTLIDRDEAMATQLERFAIERRQRYLVKRIDSALVAEPAEYAPQTIEFGCRVMVVDDDDQESSYIIVGEDEADPAQGLISWTSPLARVLMGREVGDAPLWRRPKGDINLEILSIDWPEET